MNKKLFLITVLICLIANISVLAQTVNNVPINEIKVEYVQIVGTANLMGTKVKIDIDFGQLNNVWTTKDSEIRDKNGNKMKFNSMIDALNFMSKAGYDFVSANAITVGNSNVYHYLLRKKNL